MQIIYVRHGDPTYNPDALTPLGERQAESVGRRVALFGVDKIYSSTSNRAIQTAKPCCEMLKKDMELLDFCNENYAWRDLHIREDDGREDWAFLCMQNEFASPELWAMQDKWYEHESVKKHNFGPGVKRIQHDTDEFLKGLGFEHIKNSGKYKILRENKDRIALFAHQGFGLAFLSSIMDIPYPAFCTHFDMCHTGMTVIDFVEKDGFAVPKILTLSNDSHLYRDGLPLDYNHYIKF